VTTEPIICEKVHQILQAHELKPHLVKRFRVGGDRAFEQKLEDIVGLYLNPPENAIVPLY
jgi:hypothetical protein